MTLIRPEDRIVTLIVVFTVAPERQQELVDLLIEAGATMAELPGFVSASLHRNAEGTRVVNYVQWRTAKDYEAILHDPVAQPHMRLAAKLANYEQILTDVVHVRSG